MATRPTDGRRRPGPESPPGSWCVRSEDEAQTEAAGRDLAACLAPGSVVRLVGDLGAGKTVFVRGLAAGLGIDPDSVSSPSYVLAIEHAGTGGALLHVDLYRLPEGAGLDELGIEEARDGGGIVAVEWGERSPESFARDAWTVTITRTDGSRTIRIDRPGG